MQDNPQGPNVLANEWLGSALIKGAGLPLANPRCVYVPDRFIDDNPGIWFETSEGRRRPQSGIHFGSEFVGQPGGPSRSNDYISRASLMKLSNREAFVGMYVLDLCVNSQDHRQAIMVPDKPGRLAIQFIDHGHMFGGPRWQFADRRGMSMYLERSVYQIENLEEQMASWISHLEQSVPRALSEAVDTLPPTWYKGDTEWLQHTVLERLSRLASLVEEDWLGRGRTGSRKFLKNDVQISHTDACMLSPSGRASPFRHYCLCGAC
jgi:hypothetical protein